MLLGFFVKIEHNIQHTTYKQPSIAKGAHKTIVIKSSKYTKRKKIIIRWNLEWIERNESNF